MNSPGGAVQAEFVLRAQNVSKSHGTVEALRNVNVDVRPGEIVALLGPSGCGKSTLLASLAGLVRIDSGTITLSERIVNGDHVHVPPQDRRVGLVFQDHALFPHKTVADNIGFGLHALDRNSRSTRIGEMLSLVQLTDKATRYPHQLSGGESQRVALARALAPSPDVVLLDEPFASLDPELRLLLQRQVGQMLRSVGTAAILVSHDIEDALALGDRLAVLRTGEVIQFDTAEALYRAPVDEQVAGLFGAYNDLAVTTHHQGARTILGGVDPAEVLHWPSGARVIVRPSALEIAPDARTEVGAHTNTDGAAGVVTATQFLGQLRRVDVTLHDDTTLHDNTIVEVDVPMISNFHVGDRVRVALKRAP